MPALKTYDLFISHAWRYGDNYTRLVNLLDNANNFYYRNYSAPKDKPLIPPGTNAPDSKILNAIVNKIKPVNIVLVISGMYVAYRSWIQAEINIAQEYDKPIVGIIPWGSERTPIEVQNAALEMVGWNASSIVDAIRKYAK
jgi:hypothetical protein